MDDGMSPLFVRYNADEQFTFLFGILCGLAYFIFKLVRIWQQEDTVYSNLSLSLTVFDALSILSLAACGIWGIWVGSGFGQGLKQASTFPAPMRDRS
jgi:Trk-type K+ transport system membrane component